MNINKNIFLLWFFLLVLGLGFSQFMPREKEILNTDIGLRIGSGDDITGLLLKQIIRTSKDIGIEGIDVTEGNEEVLHDFTFKDC
jgi:hypothetical protein